MTIANKYDNVNTPEELMDFMNNNIKYGFHGTDGEDYQNDGSKKSNDRFQKACRNVYRLASPEYILKYGLGHCWDQVELERDWFAKHGYEFKTIFIWFLLNYPNTYSCHTYLIYKDKITKEYCIFEHADYANRGIHRFRTYADAIKWQKDRHIDTNRQNGNRVKADEIGKIHIYEYICPCYGITADEFFDNIIYNAKDITRITLEKVTQLK